MSSVPTFFGTPPDAFATNVLVPKGWVTLYVAPGTARRVREPDPAEGDLLAGPAAGERGLERGDQDGLPAVAGRERSGRVVVEGLAVGRHQVGRGGEAQGRARETGLEAQAVGVLVVRREVRGNVHWTLGRELGLGGSGAEQDNRQRGKEGDGDCRQRAGEGPAEARAERRGGVRRGGRMRHGLLLEGHGNGASRRYVRRPSRTTDFWVRGRGTSDSRARTNVPRPCPPIAGRPNQARRPGRLAVGAAGSDAGRRRRAVARRSPGRQAGAEDEPRARRGAVEHLLDRLVDVVELRSPTGRPSSGRGGAARRPPRGRGGCRRSSRARSRPPSTVSKIGSFISLSAGRPTQTSVPPRRERAEGLLERDRVDRGGDRRVGAAEALDRRDRVLLAGVDDVLGAERAGASRAAPG